jgi:DNA-binding PadR family transcriptional regulator
MPRADRLTSTSYALLGHIALRPWSAYELTRSLRRSLHWFWPRAESRIYEQARTLVGLGLARARTERSGARSRTVYSATAAGRRALAAWLATEPEGFAYHSEALLRVHLAGFGTKDDLLRAIDAADRTAEGIFADARQVASMYREGIHPLQGDAHVRALVFDHLVSLGTMLRDWSDRTRREIARWDDLSPDGKLERAVRRMSEAAAALPQDSRGSRSPSAST